MNMTPAASYTTASLDIGVAANDRIVVASIAHMNSSVGTPPVTQSVTIGGIAATQICRAATSKYHEASMWIAAVPSGTTATVSVGIDRNVDVYAVSLTALYGVIPSPAYTVQSTPSSGVGAINGIRNGVVLVSMAQQSSYFSGITLSSSLWTGSLSLSVGYAMPSSTTVVFTLSNGAAGLPYLAASFAPK